MLPSGVTKKGQSNFDVNMKFLKLLFEVLSSVSFKFVLSATTDFTSVTRPMREFEESKVYSTHHGRDTCLRDYRLTGRASLKQKD